MGLRVGMTVSPRSQVLTSSDYSAHVWRLQGIGPCQRVAPVSFMAAGGRAVRLRRSPGRVARPAWIVPAALARSQGQDRARREAHTEGVRTARAEHESLDICGCPRQANGRAPVGRNRTTSGAPKCLISLNR